MCVYTCIYAYIYIYIYIYIHTRIQQPAAQRAKLLLLLSRLSYTLDYSTCLLCKLTLYSYDCTMYISITIYTIACVNIHYVYSIYIIVYFLM